MKHRRSMIVAFTLPFLIVGGLTVWHWYDYGLQDIHTGRLRVWKEGDDIQQPGDHWDSLKVALMIGSASGLAAGSMGVGIYALGKRFNRKS